MSSAQTHRQAWDLIPWVVNGTAPAQERTAVEAHLENCDECREELRFQRSVRAAVLAQPPVAVGEGWSRLRARLDREPKIDPANDETGLDEASVLHELEAPARAPRSGYSGWRVGWMAAAVLEAVLIGALGMALWSHTRTTPTPPWTAGYRTLSAPESVPPSATIRLVLEPSTTLAQLQGLLQRSGLTVVSGPTAAGAWSLAPSGASGRAATQAALRRLRANPAVRFAEPLGVGP